MSEKDKISSASDSDFRAEIGKNIPGNTASNAFWAASIANYVLGKYIAKKPKR